MRKAHIQIDTHSLSELPYELWTRLEDDVERIMFFSLLQHPFQENPTSGRLSLKVFSPEKTVREIGFTFRTVTREIREDKIHTGEPLVCEEACPVCLGVGSKTVENAVWLCHNCAGRGKMFYNP